MRGALADYIVDLAWTSKGAVAEMDRAALEEGYFDTFNIKSLYNSQGFALLPGDRRRRFQVAFVFEASDCAAALALFEEMRQTNLGTIELTPETFSAGVAVSSSYGVAIFGNPDEKCLQGKPEARAVKALP